MVQAGSWKKAMRRIRGLQQHLNEKRQVTVACSQRKCERLRRSMCYVIHDSTIHAVDFSRGWFHSISKPIMTLEKAKQREAWPQAAWEGLQREAAYNEWLAA
jgi:hypothetical protein